MPSSDITTTITPPILHLVVPPLEEQKQALIAQAQSLIAQFPMFKDELDIALINLKWSGSDPAKIQEKTNTLSTVIEEIKQKISCVEQQEEEPEKSEILQALYTKIYKRKKQTEFKALKEEASELVMTAKHLRDNKIFGPKLQTQLLTTRMNLSVALESDDESQIMEHVNALRILVKGISRPLQSEDSPEPKMRKLLS